MNRHAVAGICTAWLLLSGCGVSTPNPPEAAVSLPDRFSASGSAALRPEWWRAFEDPELDRLIEEALASNLSLQATWERLAQSRAAAAKLAADRYPDLTLSAQAAALDSHGDTASASKSFSAGIAASYEIDLWGRVASEADAAHFDFKTSQENLRAASVSLSAEVATVWYRLLGQHRQAAILDEQVRLNEKHVSLIERKFRSGQAAASDVLQQRQALEAVKGEAVLAANAITLLEHQLALLLGTTADALRYTPHALPDVPAVPATGVPSELLLERPDVKAAYYTLYAEDKRLASALADRYPQLSISASANSSAARADDLFRNWLLTLAGNVVAPLFDGGLRQAEAERSEAVRNEAVYEYARTVLEALMEVEDALSNVEHQQRYVDSLKRQLELSEQSVNQIRERYVKGNADFINFLSAQSGHQALQRTYVTAARELTGYSITLYRSLCTGWTNVRQDSPTGTENDRH